ncbi:MAG: 30S ribosomal protein S3 [Actinomycetota bacterium]|nr:30S ribosomal protein S3 [Actinomycetota bacterium]
MGQKVHPLGFRLGVIEDWRSRWFATKDYSKYLAEDIQIRRWIAKRLVRAAISKVEIERSGDRIKIDLYTARPGVVIGKRGAEVDLLRAQLEKLTERHVQVNIQEVSRPELDATLVAQSVAEQLSARVAFRRAMKKAVTAAMKSGAAGIKIKCAGRLGGSEMARSEWYREGRVPLHTLRAKVDYGFVEATTTFGRIGVKVWVYRGEVFGPRIKPEEEALEGLGLTDKRRPPAAKPAAAQAAVTVTAPTAPAEAPAEIKPAAKEAAKKPELKQAVVETKPEVKPKPKPKAETKEVPAAAKKAAKPKAEVKKAPAKKAAPKAAAPAKAEPKKAPAKAKKAISKTKKQEDKDAPSKEG